MSTKAKRHTHKYYRAKLTFHTVWACALPDCSHHMPPHIADLVRGKSSLCWKCEKPLIMDGRAISMDNPLCESCDPNFVSLNVEEMDDERRQKLIEIGVLSKFD